jgi:hypothetical protein
VYCGDVEEISQPLFPMGMKTPISILSPCVVSAVLHCSNSHATCTKCIGNGELRMVFPKAKSLQGVPPVSAQPALIEPAQTSRHGRTEALDIVDESSGPIVAGGFRPLRRSFSVPSKAHFRTRQRD